VAPSDRPSPTDDELVVRARDGEVRAFERLLDRHQGRVLRVLRLVGVGLDDREDVAQEVFIRVFRHLDGFRRGHSFTAWLYRVTVNAAHDHRTRSGRHARGEVRLEAVGDAADPRADAAAGARGREAREALEAALQTLSERERVVFVLREVEGLSSAEVARSLRITAITVRRHLGLARRRLRRTLQADSAEKKPAPIERPAEGGGSS
jgi:RNA polymerase sigma-70 factor (ECF subfamily)